MRSPHLCIPPGCVPLSSDHHMVFGFCELFLLYSIQVLRHGDMANICTFGLVCPTSAKWHNVSVLPSVHQMPASAPIPPQQTSPQPPSPRGSKFVASTFHPQHGMREGHLQTMHDGAIEVDFILQYVSKAGFVHCVLLQ